LQGRKGKDDLVSGEICLIFAYDAPAATETFDLDGFIEEAAAEEELYAVFVEPHLRMRETKERRRRKRKRGDRREKEAPPLSSLPFLLLCVCGISSDCLV